MSDRQIVQLEGATSNALAQIVGTGNVREGLRRVEENVRDVIDVCRARGFVQRFDGQREFFGLPAWQLLGMSYGLLPFIEWTRPLPDGWEARAVVRTVEGTDIGSAEAMALRTERNRKHSSEHDLRAMAQTRAQRNALRSVLGSALVLAGFDFADPDQPATRDQVKAIWTLAGQAGLSRVEAHERAGVVSMLELTREQATELIDDLQTLSGSARPTGERAARADPDAGGVDVASPDASASSAQSAPLSREGPARENAGEGYAAVHAGGGGVSGKGTEPPSAQRSAWVRWNTALLNFGRPELARGLTKRALRAAGREYPPAADWPPDLLEECAELLEAATERGHE